MTFRWWLSFLCTLSIFHITGCSPQPSLTPCLCLLGSSVSLFSRTRFLSNQQPRCVCDGHKNKWMYCISPLSKSASFQRGGKKKSCCDFFSSNYVIYLFFFHRVHGSSCTVSGLLSSLEICDEESFSLLASPAPSHSFCVIQSYSDIHLKWV